MGGARWLKRRGQYELIDADGTYCCTVLRRDGDWIVADEGGPVLRGRMFSTAGSAKDAAERHYLDNAH